VKLRFLVTLLLTAASCCAFVMVGPVQVVQAEDNCSKVIPMEAAAEWTIGSGATGALVFGAPLSAPASIGPAGGATLLAGSVEAAGAGVALSGSTLAMGAAAFVGAFAGTCTFLDWVTGDGDGFDYAPPLGVDDLSISTRYECGAIPGFDPGYTLSAASWCTDVTFGSNIPAGTTFDTPARGTFSVGANNFPGLEASNLYTLDAGAHGWWVNPAWQSGWSACKWYGNGAHCLDAFYSPTVHFFGTASLGPSCVPPLLGLGGVCGQHPEAYEVASNNGSVVAVFNAAPTASQKGWSRRLVTDVRCTVIDGGHTWVRAESAYYWDREVSSRLAVPECANATDVPSKLVVTRVPAGVTCATLGTPCWPAANPSASVIYTYTMPDSQLVTATAPDWVTCLTSASTCDAPALESTVCVYGGGTMTADACNPEQQAGTSTNVLTQGQTVGTLEPAPYVSGTPVLTGTAPAVDPPPDEPGVDIVIPIDPGSGLGGGTLDDGQAECWPAGWGWFNPAQWVLKPIKCALLWAFVPDDSLGESFEAFTDELFGQFPFSLVDAAAGFLGDLGGEMESASGTGCFSGSSSWSFGSAGTVQAEDMCIGDGVDVSPSQRATVLTLMLAPMVFGVLAWVWSMVLDGKRTVVAS
jgi:hypothetical protein